MKRSTVTESQIMNAIKEYEAAKSTSDICRELGIYNSHFTSGRRNIRAWIVKRPKQWISLVMY